MYKLTLRIKDNSYYDHQYTFDDLQEMVTFSEVAMKHSKEPVEVIISIKEEKECEEEKEGEES